MRLTEKTLGDLVSRRETLCAFLKEKHRCICSRGTQELSSPAERWLLKQKTSLEGDAVGTSCVLPPKTEQRWSCERPVFACHVFLNLRNNN